jgi:hypothetical protein
VYAGRQPVAVEGMGTADDRLFFGYSRVSTEEQADSNGLEAQRAWTSSPPPATALNHS